jgi:hypothetical protein
MTPFTNFTLDIAGNVENTPISSETNSNNPALEGDAANTLDIAVKAEVNTKYSVGGDE